MIWAEFEKLASDLRPTLCRSWYPPNKLSAGGYGVGVGVGVGVGGTGAGVGVGVGGMGVGVAVGVGVGDGVGDGVGAGVVVVELITTMSSNCVTRATIKLEGLCEVFSYILMTVALCPVAC